MSSILQRKRRAKLMKEMEELKTSTDVTSVESSNPESSSFIDNQSTETETVQKEVTFPDPATEDEEIEGEIDTNMEVATQSDQGQSSGPSDSLSEEEELQRMIMNFFGNLMGPTSNATSNEEYEQFMRNFTQGFQAGVNASSSFQAQSQGSAEKSKVPAAISFLFGSSNGLIFVLTFLLIVLGWNPYPAVYYAIGSLSVLRFSYLFLLATPEQAAALSSVPPFMGWILTLLNVISQTNLGDLLAMGIDSVFFSLKKYFAFRMQMYFCCTLISFIPDFDYLSLIHSISLPSIIFIAIPIISTGIVMMMYLSEHRKWRKNVLFLVDFLSLFTNQEMQDGCMKEIVREDNEIINEEKLRELMCNAYALYRQVSMEDAETFVDLHYKAALKEYRRRFVIQG